LEFLEKEFSLKEHLICQDIPEFLYHSKDGVLIPGIMRFSKYGLVVKIQLNKSFLYTLLVEDTFVEIDGGKMKQDNLLLLWHIQLEVLLLNSPQL